MRWNEPKTANKFHLSGSVAPNSPDLSPFDYNVAVSCSSGSIGCCLGMPMNSTSSLDTAINEWRNHLRACVHAEGRYFKHSLYKDKTTVDQRDRNQDKMCFTVSFWLNIDTVLNKNVIFRLFKADSKSIG